MLATSDAAAGSDNARNVVAGMVAGGCRISAPDGPCEGVTTDETAAPLSDPELLYIIEAWPALSGPLKNAILALCQSSRPEDTP